MTAAPPSGEEPGVSLDPVGSVLIIGTGLIGTSVGLGLRRRGVEVWLEDRDPGTAATAAQLGAGTVGGPLADPDVVIVAVPPFMTASTISQALRTYITSTLSDVASTKSHLQLQIDADSSALARFVPGHPLAGREVSGPAAARHDLFADRVWALAPSEATDPARTHQIAALVESLGAVPVLTTPDAHDRAVAITSHTPQVVASLVAAGLEPLSDSDARLSGQGLRDVTRLAGSDPDLWTEILSSNAGPVADALDGLIERLSQVRDGLRSGASGEVRAALAAGVSGLRKVPGKHGTEAVAYAVVPVVIEDRPGELGRLFAAAAGTGVNLEDVRIEHAQGRPTGLVELEVAPVAASELVAGLRSAGFEVRR
jgi:prephenate dehydrogenase